MKGNCYKNLWKHTASDTDVIQRQCWQTNCTGLGQTCNTAGNEEYDSVDRGSVDLRRRRRRQNYSNKVEQ